MISNLSGYAHKPARLILNMFQLKSDFQPTGDQPQAIEGIVQNVQNGLKNQVLLGVTGSGKTFTIANVIQKLQMPALIISHNKTLAGQLYQEFRDFFPENAVSYFVSYYDYYQPEAYMPSTDTYIEKEAQINELIDKLRLKSTTNLLTRKDVIVVASVSCIYNIGSPKEYGNFILELKIGQQINFNEIFARLAQLQYERNEFDFKRGTFRVRGDKIDIYPAYDDIAVRITTDEKRMITDITNFEPLSGKTIINHKSYIENSIVIYPAKHFMTDPALVESAEKQIRTDLIKEHAQLKALNKNSEADRLLRRVNYDLEMIKEVGYVNGIENYSRYFEKRQIGDPPYSLLDYFREAYGEKFLVFIDESHMSVPQIRGMFNGDYSRKKTLVDFGFRLRAAFDNRPLKFDEFYQIPKHIIYVSATPSLWEIDQSQNQVVEQLIRPTGIIDPSIEIRPAEGEIQDLLKEIEKRVILKERVLVTTLTKKIAEDLTDYCKDKNIRAAYLHSDVDTLERSDILDNLRKNDFDVLIGVNLLREGLDLPEVTLVAILDADREGFLRSKTALVQTMGRAARNIKGIVILYADVITNSIKGAVEEINRRRKYQIEYNTKNNITPTTIYKPIREKIAQGDEADDLIKNNYSGVYLEKQLDSIKTEGLTPMEQKKIIKKLEREMKNQANEMNFELAIRIRDKVREMKK
ncbi:excinuclease ABC subunit B [Candidatus Roizmanbacteria bacterium CG22_combo_CG10-13_8_21_14_all_33_16]|uniref:UvrABC system protein B n=2 Tax=Candidatus Roizmaniibacteriota TaxID=1752723 RepID=A0A2H0C414_9BACT|nr:MAG: excinuclease ABC subunit B [Candidatus Roizmanbacteria bacterium CG22_combo_CG10-13_8_21_14_all_33_16]